MSSVHRSYASGRTGQSNFPFLPPEGTPAGARAQGHRTPRHLVALFPSLSAVRVNYSLSRTLHRNQRLSLSISPSIQPSRSPHFAFSDLPNLPPVDFTNPPSVSFFDASELNKLQNHHPPEHFLSPLRFLLPGNCHQSG